MLAAIVNRTAAALLRERLRRQATRELDALSDHLLADAGIRRADIGRHVAQMLADAPRPPRVPLGRTGPSTRVPLAFNPELVASY